MTVTVWVVGDDEDVIEVFATSGLAKKAFPVLKTENGAKEHKTDDGIHLWNGNLWCREMELKYWF